MSTNGLTSGSQIGFYQLDKVIGKGNFAVVRLATHIITDTKVAIKIIDKTRLDAENRRKVAREVEIMKLLEHPNVIRLYQVMETERYLYLVTEYASKGEVFEYLISNGRMTEQDARKKFCQIVLAVDYCHRKGIVHRDLKAENLLLDESLNVKLADFGFSNHYSQSEMLKTWCGSPPYAAPELFEGKEYSGPPADIWSLGVVLYVMVCGALPFDGTNLQHLRARVLAGRFRIPFYMSEDCEKLIRRMLQLEPSKRIPLSAVLKHRWMEGVEASMDIPKKSHLSQSNVGGEGIVWNEQVLIAIQNMNYNVDVCKLAVQNRLYNDQAALYYLLLSKWEKGQLSISLPKPLNPHPRLSQSGLPPVIPQISIQKTDSKVSNGTHLNTLNQAVMNGTGGEVDEGNLEETDPNLDRYLRHGRRHTLAAAHHTIMAEDIRRFLEANEHAGNPIVNGFGSRDNPVDPGGFSGGEGLRIAWQTSHGAMGSTGIQPNLDSSQSSVGGPIRPHLHPSQAHQHPRGGRMGRRTSDGGPYVQGYKQFIEKRNHQLPLIKSSNNIERSDSAMSSTSSVKMLLMEKQLEKKGYGGLNSRKEWLLQTDLDQRKPNAVPQTMIWNHQLMANPAIPQPNAPATPDLRTQLQPFQDLQPDEIQDQLQKLHIQHPDAAAAMVVIPTQQQQQQQQQTQHQVGEYESGMPSVITAERSYMKQFSNDSSSSNSSSRKSSTTNGLIAQLLCPSPPAQPISSPQTEGLSSSGSQFTNVGTTPSLSLTITGGGRRSSLQDQAAIPKSSRPQRYTLGELYPSKQMPSFPVNVQSASRSYRETSPTNKGGSGLYNSSPTSSLTVVGRRSPNHDSQMDAIAEDTTEDSTTPTNIHPPAVIHSNPPDGPPSPQNQVGEGGGGLSVNMGSNGSFQGYPSRSTTPEEVRQRRTGVHALKSPVSPQMVSSFLEMGDLNGGVGSSVIRNGRKKSVDEHLNQGPATNGLHQLLSQPTAPPPNPTPSSSLPTTVTTQALNTKNSSTLLGMLKTPVSNTVTMPSHHPEQQQQQQHSLNLNSEFTSYPTSNYQLVQPAFPVIPRISCGQQVQKISEGDLLISHISSYLDHSGISYVHHNNIISVQHPVVHFQILITNKVQLQFIAGDANEYRDLCDKLFPPQLIPSFQ